MPGPQAAPHSRSLLQQLKGAPDNESHLTLLMATSWVPVPTPGQQEACVPSEGALRTSPTSAPAPTAQSELEASLAAFQVDGCVRGCLMMGSRTLGGRL